MLTLTPVKLFILQLLAHAGLITLIVKGSVTDWALFLVAYFFMACIGGTITYHRLLAHRAFIAPKWFEYFGSLCGTLNGGGSTISWVAIHRKHHRFTDQPEDPHTPVHGKWWKVQWFSMFPKVETLYVRDLLRSPWHNGLHRGYFSWHGLYAMLIVMFGDWWYLIPLWLAPMAATWEGASLINTVGHRFGRRPFDTNDCSTNVWWLALLVWGEGFHNNHHYAPRSANFALQPSQFDLSYQIIKLIRVKP